MKAVLDDGKSIYLQISQSIEDDILTGALHEEELIPSTNQFAKRYCINPATAAKGVNLLADGGVVYKKRGIGMCVAAGAREIIRAKRRRSFYDDFVVSLVREAEKLGLSDEEVISMIQEGEKNDGKLRD